MKACVGGVMRRWGDLLEQYDHFYIRSPYSGGGLKPTLHALANNILTET